MRKDAWFVQFWLFCWLFLIVGGGSCSRQAADLPELLPTTPFAAELPPAGALPMAEVLSGIDAASAPPGTSAATFAQLKTELKRLLVARGADKLAAAPPAQDYNAVTDLLLSGSTSEGWRLSWTYRNVGDYNQDGLVGISDLTPIGQYYQATSVEPNWSQAQVADGDGNGEVNIADITPIGSNFFSYCTGYNVYASASADGPWNLSGTAPLPVETAAGLLAFSFELGPVAQAFYRVVPTDGLSEGITSWPSMATGEPAEVSLGTDTVQTSATVGVTGGTLTGAAATPLEGVSVTIPPGALAEDAQVSLGYNDGLIVPVDGSFGGTIIAITIAGSPELAQPMEISFPVSGGAESVPVPYYIRDDGSLRPVQLKTYDPAGQTASFITSHASLYTWLEAQFSENTSASNSSQFRPQTDGFQIQNFGSHWTVNCSLGMSAFAWWYYTFQSLQDGALFPRFMYNVGDYTGQGLIAHRAQLSLHWEDYEPWRIWPFHDSADDFVAIRNALLNTQLPIILRLTTPAGGYVAVLAYGISGTRIMVYDPDAPGLARQILFNSATQTFEPYGQFNRVSCLGDGSLKLDEEFLTILSDAENSFASSKNAVIEITSHQDGQQVTLNNALVSGFVHSGAVQIEKLEITIGSKKVAEAAVNSSNGQFGVVVPLLTGTNELHFVSWGHDHANNWIGVQNNYVAECFTIKVDETGVIADVLLNMKGPLIELMAQGALDLYVLYPCGQYSCWEDPVPEDGGGVMINPLPGDADGQRWTISNGNVVHWGEPYRVRVHWASRWGDGAALETASYEIIVRVNLGQPNQEIRTYQGTLTEHNLDNDAPDATGPDWIDVCSFTPVQPPE